MVSSSLYLVVSLIMFTIGAIGVIIRRDAMVAFMCIEMMLNAVNLTFVTLSRLNGNLDGQVAVLFVMVVAATESAIGLALILTLFRNFRSVNTSDASELKG